MENYYVYSQSGELLGVPSKELYLESCKSPEGYAYAHLPRSEKDFEMKLADKFSKGAVCIYTAFFVGGIK